MNEIVKCMSDAALLRMFFIDHMLVSMRLSPYAEYEALYEELRRRGYDMCEVIDEARFLTAFGNSDDRKAFADNWEETCYNSRF